MNRPGDINTNDQQILRLTQEPGNGKHSRVWILKCLSCFHIYGCNGHDAFERRCPKCDRGVEGLSIPIEQDGREWTREEHILAFHLYSKIPFGTIHMRNPKIIELAALLGRKIGSITLKLVNFARLDPVLQARNVRGMGHGSRGEIEVWERFSQEPEELAFESANLMAERLGLTVEKISDIDQSDLPSPGTEREALVKVRVKQSFFRDRVLSAYNFRCCVTGLSIRPLLVASHIVPWAEDAKHRLDPRNGLCLNALHDRAFDRGLMWVEPELVVRLSPKLRKDSAELKTTVDWLFQFDLQPLRLPATFQPDVDFLAHHAKKSKKLAGI